MDPSAAVEARVREHVAHLERFHPELIGCQVVIEGPPAHRHKGAPYDIHVELQIPGDDIHVRSERDDHEAHLDVYVALRDAFDAAKRMLRARAAERHGESKHRDLPHLGTVEQLENSYGRIAADDGHTVYFHRNSVHDARFDQLSVGTVVEFEEELGNHGPQAAAVRVRHGRTDKFSAHR